MRALLFRIVVCCAIAPFFATDAFSNPVDILDFVLTDRGFSLAERQGTKNAIAKVMVNNGVSAVSKAKWLPFAMKYLGKVGTYGTLALAAYDLYEVFSDDGFDTLKRSDIDLQISDIDPSFQIDDHFLRGVSATFIIGWTGKYDVCPVDDFTTCLRSEIWKAVDYSVHHATASTFGVSDMDLVDAKAVVAHPTCTATFPLVSGGGGTFQLSRLFAPDEGVLSGVEYRRLSGVSCSISYEASVSFTHSVGGVVVGPSLKTVTGVGIGLSPITSSNPASTIQGEKADCKRYLYQDDLYCNMGLAVQNPAAMPIPLNLDGTTSIGGADTNTGSWWADNSLLSNNNNINPKLVADFDNQLWKDASKQPNYTGVKYTDPQAVTPGEVSQVYNNYYNSYYNFQDVDNVIRNGDNNTFNWVTVQPSDTVDPPVTDPDPGDGDDDPDQPGDDGGVDTDHPDVGEPQFPEIPTIKQIMDPVLNVFPLVKQWSVPVIEGECPKPSFEAFDRTFQFEAHCELVEENRQAIGASFMVVYAIASVLIVLRA